MRCGLDAGAEVPQLAVDPLALDHVFDPETHLLVESHVAHAPGLGLAQIAATSKAAVGCRLMRCLTIEGARCRPSCPLRPPDRGSCHSCRWQVELVAVVDVAGAFDDDIGVRLEQADQLLAGRHAPLALGDDLL